jgi:hypothetical protein
MGDHTAAVDASALLKPSEPALEFLKLSGERLGLNLDTRGRSGLPEAFTEPRLHDGGEAVLGGRPKQLPKGGQSAASRHDGGA